ncbi:GIY-YIG nuclease family protein [Flavobacterium sp. PL12]|uniref:GIY-YIG nuclease family protein n=1 Tax=Flavobacterium sp. PL12 TaxID=3071718 RepID=UPI00319DAA00
MASRNGGKTAGSNPATPTKSRTAMFGFFCNDNLMHMYVVYILFSRTSLKFYTGQTDNLENRLYRHNAGLSLSNKYGKPWELIYKIDLVDRSQAVQLETKIKKRGAKRYLEDIKFL